MPFLAGTMEMWRNDPMKLEHSSGRRNAFVFESDKIEQPILQNIKVITFTIFGWENF